MTSIFYDLSTETETFFDPYFHMAMQSDPMYGTDRHCVIVIYHAGWWKDAMSWMS